MVLNMMWILILGVVGWLVFSNKGGGGNDFMNTLKNWWVVGALFGVGSVALTWAWTKYVGPITLKLATPALEFDVRSRIEQGLSTSIGEKIWGYFSGYLPIAGNFQVWIVAALTGIAIAVVGRMLYTYLYKGTQKTKVALVLLYGTIVFGLIFKTMTASLSVAFGSMLITWFLYYIVLAWIMTMIFSRSGVTIPN